MTTTSTKWAIEQVAEAYSEAWSACDLTRIMGMHATKTRFQIHNASEPAIGQEAVREAFARTFQAWPNLRVATKRMLFGTHHWVLDWTLVADTSFGREVRFDCVDLVEVDEGGLVTSKDTFIDAAQLQKALS